MMLNAMKTTHFSDTAAPNLPATAPACRRILVPLDLTADSHQALQYAARLAKEENISVCLLHVVDFGPFDAAMTEYPFFHSRAHLIGRAERHLRMLAHQELPTDLPVRIVVRPGKPSREIVKAAQGICADLIILSAPKQTLLTRLFSGHSTRWIESHAPCSVFILRKPNYGPCHCSEAESRRSTAATTVAR
jgi:nucleotide-binding universal stress UspA family protein